MAGKSLADYRAEYTREPFTLDLGDGTVVAIPQKTLGQVMDAEQAAAGSILETLVILAGDQGELLRAALLDSPPGVIIGIRDDAYLHCVASGSGEATDAWSMRRMSALVSRRTVSSSTSVRLAPTINGLRAMAHRLSCVCCSSGVRRVWRGPPPTSG